ncbi:TonB-dependent receptor plug domain-containing protein [Moraxella nasicaprae]|uniref:TonB-dependent receptor plug domain-containing protein n=1 Tax=Moraxella nasicaprae TaxID=2904122 RepID=A0ABY6F5P0_9GAMM|nr:TonB-dependent receptor plug domain-containing protein [Moraxella nasicaprae]UXZ05363.1 TonB-dependent receptor plug domain-containing protein [Moraxella nasicaprae]
MSNFITKTLTTKPWLKSFWVSPLALSISAISYADTHTETAALDSSPVVDLGELTITATRANTKLNESAQKVLIIDRQTIDNQLLAGDDMSQALFKLIPGYAPPTGNMGSVSESFRGREVLFMIDGVPQSNPLRDGSRENRTIDLSMVERIEVIYGASSEHGLGATGGIINFITKKNRGDGLKQSLSIGVNTAKNFEGEGLGGDVRYQASFGGEKLDGLVALKYGKEGMYYGADDRLVGTYGNQGDVMNASHYDVLAKVGYAFDDNKRLSASVNHYFLEGSQEYVNDSSQRNRAIKRTDTSVKRTGAPDGLDPYNKVLTANVVYQDDDFLSGRLTA